jgi:transcription antitermination factor NusG
MTNGTMMNGTALTNTRLGAYAIDSGGENFAQETIFQAHWYAAYTRANHERRVAQELAERDVEHLLPQYQSRRKWKDREVELSLPLFPGYIFVRVALEHKLRVLQVPGVACLVSFAGKPAVVPAEEFERIQELLSRKVVATPHPYLNAGRRVRVLDGPFSGLEGVVIRRNKRSRLVISLHLIARSIAVELGEANLGPVEAGLTTSRVFSVDAYSEKAQV